MGPYNKRASSLIYLSWVQQAGGSVKGQSAVPPKDEQQVVVPLFLLKQSNEEQMDRLHALLRKASFICAELRRGTLLQQSWHLLGRVAVGCHVVSSAAEAPWRAPPLARGQQQPGRVLTREVGGNVIRISAERSRMV